MLVLFISIERMLFLAPTPDNAHPSVIWCDNTRFLSAQSRGVEDQTQLVTVYLSRFDVYCLTSFVCFIDFLAFFAGKAGIRTEDIGPRR